MGLFSALGPGTIQSPCRSYLEIYANGRCRVLRLERALVLDSCEYTVCSLTASTLKGQPTSQYLINTAPN